ncbi:uncharacterized protein Z519_06711 [Cladophialophora bantiana CBS 173.52]|uniref:Uncharacterized protein n=1 Tax=Cladophialophora bantiana (strain ATCC 10958 / CBS 173.52 / CDC B-1940 / NIH 8579) TaxID=1442370 RepID=A0A0D2G2B9_CLAB1|nr:uncharacterized protein Z519_06711 [Cladophialophora bantiana CBS 173.52]KIW92862.1 hypothetical protein Z519_06711 [Cladophialophora bantiana CBS 173.52]
MFVNRCDHSADNVDDTVVRPAQSEDLISRERTALEALRSTGAHDSGQASSNKRHLPKSPEFRRESLSWYLEDGQCAYLVFHTLPSFRFTSVDVDRVITLGPVLCKTAQVGRKKIGLQLSKHDRLSIALTMSYAFLELYPTP